MKIPRALVWIVWVSLAAGLVFLWVKIEKIGEQPTETAPIEVSEDAMPMAAAPSTIVPTTYCSYHLIRGAGAIAMTGATWVSSEAWRYTPAGTPTDNTLFMRDLIATLDADGVLAGADLTKTKSNWLIILHPGGTARKDWVLDSRDLPQEVKE